MQSWHDAIPFFSPRELACHGSKIIRLDIRLAVELPRLRMAWGAPLVANSVCRDYSRNLSTGGHPRSLHLMHNPVHDTAGSMAADLRWASFKWEKQRRLARLAWSMGWSVGLHDAFIHVDRRRDLGMEQRVFTYLEWSGFDADEVSAGREP